MILQVTRATAFIKLSDSSTNKAAAAAVAVVLPLSLLFACFFADMVIWRQIAAYAGDDGVKFFFCLTCPVLPPSSSSPVNDSAPKFVSLSTASTNTKAIMALPVPRSAASSTSCSVLGVVGSIGWKAANDGDRNEEDNGTEGIVSRRETVAFMDCFFLTFLLLFFFWLVVCVLLLWLFPPVP